MHGKQTNERHRFFANGESLFPVELTQYDPDIIRELLHNCIAHQDYAMQGRVNVEEFEDHLVFINEGSFIPESIERAMVPGYKPSYYRNPQLRDAMVQLDMIGAAAMGIPKIFKMQRDRYFPLPIYDLNDPNRVVVSIYGKCINESYSRLLHARPDLELDVVYLLDRVQKGEGVSAEQAAKLHEMGFVEGRLPQLAIAGDYVVRTDGRSEHVCGKGLDDEACRQVVLQMLRDTGPAKRGEILAKLGDLLPAELTKEQKERKVSNLLAGMKKVGAIVNNRTGNAATWRIA